MFTVYTYANSLYICTYMHIYIIFVYIYVYYTYIHVPVQVPILSRLYPHINTYTPCAFNIKQFQSRGPKYDFTTTSSLCWVCIYIYTHVHTCTCIHVYTCICIYTYTYKHIYIYTYIDIDIICCSPTLNCHFRWASVWLSRPWNAGHGQSPGFWRYETNSHWELSLGTCPETISLKNGRRIRKFLLASFKCPNKLGLTRIQIHQTYPKMVRHLSLWLSGLTNRSRVNRHQLEICSCKYIVLYSYIIYILQYDWIGLWSSFFLPYLLIMTTNDGLVGMVAQQLNQLVCGWYHLDW